MPEPEVFTKEQVDAMVAERLVAETAAIVKKDRELLAETKAAKAALAKFDGVDPDEFKRLKTAADEAERKKATAEGNFASLEKQLIEKHQAEIAGEKGRSTKLQSALERRLVQAELTSVIAKHRGDADLLLPHAAQFVRVREVEDGFEAYVADEKGNPRIADGKGTPMSFDDLVTQVLVPKYPRAFDGTGSTGGGASKSTGSVGGTRVIAADDHRAIAANLQDIAAGKVVVAR